MLFKRIFCFCSLVAFCTFAWLRFCAFGAFCYFCACEIFSQKNSKKFKTALIISFILLLNNSFWLHKKLFLGVPRNIRVLKKCSKFTGEHQCRSEICRASLLKPHFGIGLSCKFDGSFHHTIF